ncbi:methylenetetrahydrofolate--tRNA-(uracil(54)-C(5))-methyltransferase (FADH(2)-oxidizing) TrmFO [Mailhella sp.]|uniref:methylenetetrahydrofolate--tRNA-(uracil(54)- C(5))-methyltransferase (FADH(2)-oxidizing) TrmFO n=1 Tax=Mailhella sp. TaxID=1981029 RepID=UPI003AB87043
MDTISTPAFAIIGGGLAGCECALALARAGLPCELYEQKPEVFSPAHVSPLLGELVCSNSFRSNDAQGSGVGLLKQEMRKLGSATMAVAERCSVPAGKALAVDRSLFSQALTRLVEEEPLITLIRRQIPSLDDPALEGKTVIVAAGPLVSENLASSLADAISSEGEKTRLYFYDAIAPIVRADSVDMTIAFRGSRYGNDAPPPYSDDAPFLEKPMETMVDPNAADNGDYLNCPMTRAEYTAFYEALRDAERVPAHDFEKEIHFEGCMPIEALADRGERTLTFGPLKPVGFTDPRTGRRPYALLQLRAENAERTSFNLVGCQTKMTYGAQDRVFRLVPGLAHAEFLRFGSVHRNTYVNAPECLNPDLSLKKRPNVHLAGQITGVEGYVESAACGLWLGILLAARAHGKELPLPPQTTALGALMHHLRAPAKQFTPSNVHFGLMPELEERAKKKARKTEMADRGRVDFDAWLSEAGL